MATTGQQRTRQRTTVTGRASIALAAVVALVAAAAVLAGGQAGATHQDPAARGIGEACPADPAGTHYDAGFTDIAGNPHERAIRCVVWWRIAEGVTDDAYVPSARLRRDQMASLVAGTLNRVGVDVPFGAPQAFPDVGEDNIHAHAVNALADLGVVVGDEDGAYRPARAVRRDQMASYLSRAAEHTLGEALADDHQWFADVDEANPHFAAVNGAAAAGITQGRDADARRYAPQGPIRRDQIASFLMRTLDLLAAEGVVTVPDGAHAEMVGADGEELGVVRFVERPDGQVEVDASLEGLSSGGVHGFHLHETGSCGEGFAAAGDHYDPDDRPHGQHAGDFPVLLADGDGKVLPDFATDRFAVEELLAGDGTAVVVHAQADNYAHIPERYGGPDEQTLASGDAGARLACGVVQRPGPPPGPVTPGVFDPEIETVVVDLVDAAGNDVGAVGFTGVVNGRRAVTVTAKVEGLSPGGVHGFHLHEADGFDLAELGSCGPDLGTGGGHYDPDGKPHGQHAGDFPVLLADADGTARTSFWTDRVKFSDVADGDLVVTVHQRADNFANIPERYGGPDEETLTSGDAGDRLACGVVESEDR